MGALRPDGLTFDGVARPAGRATLVRSAARVSRDGVELTLPVLASRDPAGPDPAVERIVLHVHGERRRPDDHLARMPASALADPALLVVAPWFRTAAELEPDDAEPGLYWSASGWKEGSLSRLAPLARPWRISSFDVLDALAAALADPGRHPSLRTLVVTGHSAGAQLVQRFVAGSGLPDALAAGGVETRFVVANPSSYLYLGRERWDPVAAAFAAPTDDALAACPELDRYKYGLTRRPLYLAGEPRRAIRARYAARTVLYAAGAADDDPGHPRLDRSCAALAQGATRLERARRFHASLLARFGPEVARRHRLVVLPGVGHDVGAVFGHPDVAAEAFGPTVQSSGSERTASVPSSR